MAIVDTRFTVQTRMSLRGRRMSESNLSEGREKQQTWEEARTCRENLSWLFKNLDSEEAPTPTRPHTAAGKWFYNSTAFGCLPRRR